MTDSSCDILDFDNFLFAGSRQGKFLEYWLEKLSITNKNLIFHSKSRAFLIDEAFYPSYSLPIWRFTEGKYQFIMKVLGDDFQAPGDTTRRLFVSRAGLSRSIVNQEQLMEIAKYYGFQSIRPDFLSVPEQIRLFSEAKFIVGAHGGAFTNALFSTAPSVFEFFGSSYVNTIFFRLTQFKGGRYHYHVSNSMRLDSFYVKENVLNAWLAANC